MSKAWNKLRRLGKDEEGAALIEYTVLLGILVVAVIATIVAVGAWVNGKWTTLQAKLSFLMDQAPGIPTALTALG